jgi:hypothetical protein
MAALCRDAATGLQVVLTGSTAVPAALDVPGVRLTATNLAWGYGYTVERSADLQAWTNVLGFAATNGTHALQFPRWSGAMGELYRLRSP